MKHQKKIIFKFLNINIVNGIFCRWWLCTILLSLVLLGAMAQDEGSGEEGGEEASGDGAEAPAEGEEGGEEGAEASGDAPPAEEGAEGGDGDAGGDAGAEEECETEVTDGSGSGDGGIDDILALGGESKKCKPKAKSDSADASGSGDEALTGADALAAVVGGGTCDKEGMDDKVKDCLEGLETKVNDLTTAIMGPDGGGGTLEDKITLVLVKKGVISCESEEQCDDDKQCLKQSDGMSRCQNPCERPEIIRLEFLLFLITNL